MCQFPEAGVGQASDSTKPDISTSVGGGVVAEQASMGRIFWLSWELLLHSSTGIANSSEGGMSGGGVTGTHVSCCGCSVSLNPVSIRDWVADRSSALDLTLVLSKKKATPAKKSTVIAMNAPMITVQFI